MILDSSLIDSTLQGKRSEVLKTESMGNAETRTPKRGSSMRGREHWAEGVSTVESRKSRLKKDRNISFPSRISCTYISYIYINYANISYLSHFNTVLCYVEIYSYIYFCINPLQSETKMDSLLDRESWTCLLGDFHHKPETVEGNDLGEMRMSTP